MKSLRILPLLLAVIFLAGCETIDRQDREVLRAHDVPPDVFDKMLYGDPLSLSDVIELSQRAVPPGLIIHYMHETDTVYVLGKSDVKRLRAAGVNEPVIGYMLSTAPGYYGPGGPPGPPPYGYPYPGPYYADGPYPYGYYGGPVFFVGGYGPWGWGRGWGGHWGRGGWHRH